MNIIFHAHTTYSHDGKLSCQELSDLGRQQKIDVIFVSDHYEDFTPHSFSKFVKECKFVSETNECKLIPGYEKRWFGFDLCAFGLYEWTDDDDLTLWAKKINNQKAFIGLVHPIRYKHKIPSNILEVVDGIEVWNSKWPYDGKIIPHPGITRLMNDKSKIYFAGQDIHKRSDGNSLRLEIANTKKIDNPIEIINLLKLGDFSIRTNYIVFNKKKLQSFSIPLLVFHTIRRHVLFTSYSIHKQIKKLFKP
ncbi:MAG TPA: hypothetical protein ENI82_04795 [Bacteroidetes bacterium]|nr:hypothetical protein [Bacteroidota bacterium]